MKAYVRKLFPHDLTHEVSVQSMYVGTYFDTSSMSFHNVHNPTHDYDVCINDVTDPRFGGRFKSIYRSETPRVGDFLVIKRLAPRRYSLELVKTTNSRYAVIKSKFECCCVAERHAIIDD